MATGDPDLTAARQMGAFLQLKKLVERLADDRFYQNAMTPDETRFVALYYAAWWDVAKTREAYQKFTGLKGYDINPYFTDTLLRRYFSAGVRRRYEALEAGFAQRIAARARADTQSFIAARSQEAAAQQQLGQSGTEERAIMRCLESGGSPAQCIARGVGSAFRAIAGETGLAAPVGPRPSGLRMGGIYQTSPAREIGLTFYPDQVVVKCQDLEPDPRGYTVAIVGGQARITVQSSPSPLVFTMRPDGTLIGSSPMEVAGRVQIGSQAGTRTWSDGRTEPISRPLYGPATRSCTVPILPAIGPSPAFGSSTSMGGALLNALTLGADPAAENTDPPGIRMTGEYGVQTGFALEFRPEGVSIGCRDVTVLRAYRIEIREGRAQVQIDYGPAGMTMSLGPDGRLTGSGTVRVDGRALAGFQGDGGGPVYSPRSASCTVGSIAPSGATLPTRAPAGVESAPAPATAALALATPLATKSLFLLDGDLVALLPASGFAPASGQSLLGTLARCSGNDNNCLKAMQVIATHTVAVATTDGTGSGVFPGVPPGNFFLFALGGSRDNPTVWNVPVTLRTGDNTLILNQANATGLR